MSIYGNDGINILDPYRSLEEDSTQTHEFEQAQHQATLGALRGDPYWGRVHRRLDALLSHPEQGVPKMRGPWLAFMARGVEDNQTRLEVTRRDGTDRQVVFDTQGAGLPQAVDWFTLSEDGRYVIFGVSQQGDEWATLRIFDTQSGKLLEEHIPGTRWASVAMPANSQTFYYTRYPLDGSGRPHFYHQQVYCHRLGTDYRMDRAIYSDAEKTATFSVSVSGDGTQLLLDTHRGWTANRLVVRSLEQWASAEDDIILFDSVEERIEPFWHQGSIFGMQQSPDHAGRIVRWDASEKRWDTVVEAREGEPLQACYPAHGGLVILLLREARTVLQWYSDTHATAEIHLPHGGIGSVFDVETDPEGTQAFLGWSSFDQPRQVLSLNTVTLELDSFGEPVPAVPDITVWQEWAPSRDGTMIPVFFAKQGPKPDGLVPAVVGGYGGFNIAYSPVYSPGIQIWLESGGLYAVAGLRGGSEFGESWHRAGMRERKQNVFDDMAAALKHVARQGYSDAAHMAVTGRSNGGLLSGAVITQHPELVRAAVVGVPLLDMLRYDRFLVAALWTAEYGDPHTKEEWGWLQRYSPYHHVVPHTKYPAVIIFTSAHDSRVAPLHARKMAARLQASTASGYPIFLRIEPHAGHGLGKTREQQAGEEADIWTFLFRQLNLTFWD